MLASYGFCGKVIVFPWICDLGLLRPVCCQPVFCLRSYEDLCCGVYSRAILQAHKSMWLRPKTPGCEIRSIYKYVLHCVKFIEAL